MATKDDVLRLRSTRRQRSEWDREAQRRGLSTSAWARDVLDTACNLRAIHEHAEESGPSSAKPRPTAVAGVEFRPAFKGPDPKPGKS